MIDFIYFLSIEIFFCSLSLIQHYFFVVVSSSSFFCVRVWSTSCKNKAKSVFDDRYFDIERSSWLQSTRHSCARFFSSSSSSSFCRSYLTVSSSSFFLLLLSSLSLSFSSVLYLFKLLHSSLFSSCGRERSDVLPRGYVKRCTNIAHTHTHSSDNNDSIRRRRKKSKGISSPTYVLLFF